MHARNVIIALVALAASLPLPLGAQSEGGAAGPPPPPNPVAATKARAEYLAWRSGNVVRAHYDEAAKPHITSELLSQVRTGLTQAGDPQTFTLERVRTVQNGIRVYDFLVQAAHGAVGVEMGVDPDGLIGGIYFQPLAPRSSQSPAS